MMPGDRRVGSTRSMGVSPRVKVLLHTGGILPIRHERSDVVFEEKNAPLVLLPMEYHWPCVRTHDGRDGHATFSHAPP
jgi:hypothetical protein